ncbi:MAG: peptide chain release factor aRF-1 [Nitrososphaeria archaeon]
MEQQYDSVEVYRVKRLLTELANVSGRGTELISLYIPPKRPPYDVINQLKEEYGTASNIKSDQTRTHVQDALVHIMQRLKLYKQFPENGLIVFCGYVPSPDNPANLELKYYEIVPPKPVPTSLYRCDDHFHLDILKSLLKEEDLIGVISLDLSEAGFGIIAGDRVEVIEVITSGVGSKHRQGGQSARRFERIRENEINEFFHRVAAHAKEIFIDTYRVKKLIISGPGMAKEDFFKGDYLDYRLKQATIGLVDTGYAGEEGIRETLERGEELIEGVRLIEEKKIIDRFLAEASKKDGLVVYGLEPSISAIKDGNADLIIISEDINTVRIEAQCRSCGYTAERFVQSQDVFKEKSDMAQQTCPVCGKSLWDIKVQDIVDYVTDLATQVGARVEIVSSKSEAGVMFKNFGGIGVMLRYQKK